MKSLAQFSTVKPPLILREELAEQQVQLEQRREEVVKLEESLEVAQVGSKIGEDSWDFDLKHLLRVRASLRNASSGIASERALMHRFRTRLLNQLQQDINPKGVVALLTSSATRYKP